MSCAWVVIANYKNNKAPAIEAIPTRMEIGFKIAQAVAPTDCKMENKPQVAPPYMADCNPAAREPDITLMSER